VPDLYETTPVPAVPDRTAAIDQSWVEAAGGSLSGEVADGRYWATATGIGEGEGERVVLFDLSQAFFGEACTAQFATDVDACASDYGVLAEPHGELPAVVDGLDAVSVVGEDQRNLVVDGDELFRLVRGDPPAAAAPDEYRYVGFPFLLTVQDATIISAAQIWVPEGSSGLRREPRGDVGE